MLAHAFLCRGERVAPCTWLHSGGYLAKTMKIHGWACTSSQKHVFLTMPSSYPPNLPQVKELWL